MHNPSPGSGRPSFHSAFQQVHDDTAADDRQQIGVEQLAQYIRETADKLIRDGATRGDIKLLSTALKELRYSFKVFTPYRHLRKASIFGSARLPESHPAYAAAVEFSRRIAEAGWMVITGAANGIMEAGHVGAGREKSIGVNILLPFEQEANPIIRGDLKLMHLKYFFTRKLLFVKESDAVALFPGGFGTQDECFEVLTLLQTGKAQMFPIVMVDEPGGDYWLRWREYIENELRRRDLISPSDMSLFKVTDSVEEAVEEVLGFYRVYHSMRYVRGDLLLRLQHRLSDERIEQLRHDFADIVVAGAIEQTEALTEEANDTHIAQLPRLRFRFDRRNLGRLRQMIDSINRA
jgi:uncharacterized protein (TIGR00730 family)